MIELEEVELTEIVAGVAVEVVNKAHNKVVMTKDAVKRLLKGEREE